VSRRGSAPVTWLSMPANNASGACPAVATGPMPSLPTTYVHPGQLVTSNGPGVLSTILGSCVAVCLHDAQAQIGGLNHYLLPTLGAVHEQPGRYAPTAIDELVHRIVRDGACRDRLVATIVGGASVLAAFDDADHLGMRNVAAARTALSKHRIRIISADVGGRRGRKLQFSPRDGQVHVQLIGA
jgi:chemotaxis protein CheD